ncbi:MAG: hydrogenase expression protein [SAR202 cluster bacterium]|nr:hydrogenase expression protein [SAR202 cluster bacterium]
MDITTEGSLDIGKLPADLLGKLLSTASTTDPRVLLGPRVGADAAVIDMGDTMLVAKSDPVTFAADRIGWYAVQVNANDIACLGAMPKWFLATVLLPEGAAPELAEEIFREITDACAELGVALVGGHTEITYGLTRPIVSGHMLGEAKKADVVWPGGAQPGDTLPLTLGLAIEGTALLAREAANALRDGGMSDADVAAAASLLESPGISVVHAAQTACTVASVHAMHDPTEGGLATGLAELASAAEVGVEVRSDALHVLPETQLVCRALGLEPLGLLASGALLMALASDDVEVVQTALSNEGIPSQVIGRVTEASEGLRIRNADGLVALPIFARDELARFMSQPS